MKKIISALIMSLTLSAALAQGAYANTAVIATKASGEKESSETGVRAGAETGILSGIEAGTETMQSSESDEAAAEDITKNCRYLKIESSVNMTPLQNGLLSDCVAFGKGASLSINADKKIGSLYIQFYNIPSAWTAKSGDKEISCGKNGFLHEYIDVSSLDSNSIALNFTESADIAEIYVFSDGKVPDFVQIWNPPCETADLLLLVSHSDDEHLFFGGVLPYYTAIGYNVQVAYLTNHSNYKIRTHEQLNSLWTAGVRNYPIIGKFPDLYSTELDYAYSLYREKGYTPEDFIEYEVYLLRRFKPLVVMTHAFSGEYGHGTHKICADAMSKAVFDAADPLKYTDSATEYGTWSTPKLYFHLYDQNNIKLSFADTPMKELGGKTPFYYSQQAYLCNTSQLPEPSLTKWMCGTEANPVTLASSIRNYSPISFGLYTSTVGDDTDGAGDPFENIIPYNKQAEIILEEQKKNEELLNQIREENDRRDEQLRNLDRTDVNGNELEALKNDYERLVEENNQKISKIENVTKAMYIASAVFAVIFILTLLSLILNLKAIKKAKSRRRRPIQNNDSIQK